MRCYRCNSKLSENRDICTKCGTDIRFYRKIIYTSNQYYNLGLMKARARDLTGAAESLRTCLQLNKKNVNARNLLGLVYYEMGEAAQALKEWVISKNYKYRNNIADHYIQDLRDNRQALDGMSHSIHKFNQALEYAQTGAIDLAVIQLKKVISVNPNMLKAYQLLALLYIHQQKYDQARSVLRKCLEIDRGNICAISYLKELRKMRPASKKKNREVVGETDREEVIIPVRMRDYGSYLASAIYILLGAVIALGILYYVVIPGKEREIAAQNKVDLSSYQEQYDELNATIRTLEDQITQLENERADMESNLNSSNEESSNIQAAYDRMLELANVYIAGDLVQTVSLYQQIDGNAVDTSSYQQIYNTVKAQYDGNEIYDALMNQGNTTLGTGNFAQAMTYYEAAMTVKPDQDEPVYQAAWCAQNSGNADRARELYQRIITEFPRSSRYNDAASHLRDLGGA